MGVLQSAAKALGIGAQQSHLATSMPPPVPHHDRAGRAAARAAESVPASGRLPRRRREPPPARLAAPRHAFAFVNWLQGEGYGGRRIEGFDRLERLYFEFCRTAQIVARPWGDVARHFGNLLQRPGKPRRLYGWQRDPLSGDLRRVRVYDVPARAQDGEAVP